MGRKLVGHQWQMMMYWNTMINLPAFRYTIMPTQTALPPSGALLISLTCERRESGFDLHPDEWFSVIFRVMRCYRR